MNKKFNLSDQVHFAQRLSLLLQSGISMTESLLMMKNMESSESRKKAYSNLIQNIEHGISLSRSIKNAGIAFNDILLALIRNGESSGHLSEALQQAYSYLEKRNEMKKKLIGSLLYPVFIVLATIAMTLFLVLYIFPKIIPLLSSLDIELPLITRIVQGIYYFSINYGFWFLLMTVFILFLFHFCIRKSRLLKYKWHKFIISIPFLHSYIKTYLMSSFCGMGEMFLSSGKGLPDLLLFSKDSMKNIVYQKALANIYAESIQGVSFSTSLQRQGILFPPLLADLCALGERTGNLATMLGHCSRIFEQDIDNFLKRLSSLIEPALMVLMGLVVGSVALSIILPVYEITNHITK